MNFQEYREQARRTMNSELGKELQAAVAALGLVGEACEFTLALVGRQSIDEAGDVCWYMAWLCDLYGIHNLTAYNPGKEDILTIAATIADMVKKNVGHNHPMPVAVLQRWLEGILWLLEVDYGDLSEVYETNIAKLKWRYPNGFNSADSIARADVQPFEANPTSQFINTAEWVIDSANPCVCQFPHKDSLWYRVTNEVHFLTCGVCGNGFYDTRIDHLLAKWNDVNVDAPVE